MKWPTMDEFAQMVADKAIDEIEYNGKTIREWTEIILATASEDTISRRAAIDALDKCHCGGKDENGRPWIYKENAVEAIEMVEPSPPAEPKTGKWIRDGHHIRCDQCGMYMCDTDREGDRIPTEFCSSCGAKMDEVTT